MKNHSRNPCLPMWLVVVCLCVTSVAQISLPPGLAVPDSQPTASTPKDPFGRQSPQSAVLNFLRVAHHGDYVVAARYLELPGPKEKRIGPELARKLLNLMDTSLLGSVATLSTSPEGLSSDSSDPDIEVLGHLLVHNNDVPFHLVRTTEKDIGPVWLVSWQTVQQVPQLYESARAPILDQYFPAVLANNFLFGIPAGRWIAWLLTIPIALAVGWLLLRLARWLYQAKKRDVPFQWSDLGKPTALILAILLHGLLVILIGMPLFYRVYYFRFLAVLLAICVAWFGIRFLDRLHRSSVFQSRGRESQSFLQLGYQLLKVAIVVATALAVLAIMGFNTKTMLAGLGIGGIAVALAAQKTLENLLGGITLVMDNTLFIGDDCLISGRYVTIQNVGLRSTAAMTREGTDISFPNGMLVQNSIENLSRRNRFLILTTLGLSSRCSLEQVQYVIARVREMLYSHSRVEQRTARFRMTGVQGLAYNVELFAYVLTGNYADFAAIQEDIFFRITRIVESAGASWAIPGQLSFPTPNQLIDEDKAASAQRVVQEWQDKSESPFPDFSDDRIAHLRGSISYPPHSSDPPTKNENPFKKAV